MDQPIPNRRALRLNFSPLGSVSYCMGRSRRFKLIFFLAVAAIAALAGLLTLGSVFQANDSIPTDRLAEVKRGDLSLSVVATGSVIPVTRVELKSKASGLVKNILVQEGDRVAPGQTLIELDKEILQAQLREAQANLTAIRARVEVAQADVESARSQKQKMLLDVKNLADDLRFREKQVQRYRSMSSEKIISLAELDRVERDFQDASLKLEALKSELLVQDSKIQAAQKEESRVRAEVIQAEANLDRVLENLRYATVTSPLEGTVLKRHVEIGDAVSSILQLGSQATLLMTLGDMKEVFVEGRVDESDIGRVYVGQQARVKVDAFRERAFPGRVVRIAPLGVEKDNVIGFDVRVAIDDPEGILRANMSANAEIITEEKKDVLLIPESAIVYDRDRKTHADLYDPAAPEMKRRVPIEIGASNGTLTEIVTGVAEGDRLVLPERGLI